MGQEVYNLTVEASLAVLESGPQGLTQGEAERRLAQHGPNEILFRKTPWWIRLLRQFNDPMVFILLTTAAITGTLTVLGNHMLPDTIVIVGVVLFNALLGFFQEGKAEGALEALRNMMVRECLAIRDGEERRIAARTLVPGDLVIVESGDKIPADLRFLRLNNLHADESSLTGESVPVQKVTEALEGDNLVPGDQRNIAFSGTYVSQGTGRGVVIATGGNTAFGRIADMVSSVEASMTPLQRRMKDFVHSLIIAILAIGAFNFLYGLYLGYEISYSFLGAVSLVVAAIPEMLPALVTSVLALSAVVMARRKALIRKLPAAETLGATSVICSDKTGTLTENKMTVTRLSTAGRVIHLGGEGTSLEGEFRVGDEPVDVCEDAALRRLLQIGQLCNNASLHESGAIGDPTEIALRVSGAKGGLSTDGSERLEEVPFSSEAKFMAVLVDAGDERLVLVKGAPEVILDRCAQELADDGGSRELDRDGALARVRDFSSDALRTLAFAFRVVARDHEGLGTADLEDLTLAGLQGMIDPPKAAAIEAVSACRGAGIRTVMITGDHPSTAQAVARQLGIDAEHIHSGVELSGFSEQKLREVVERVSVYARVAPEHKKAIAEALQANGHVVAMTGDGVNDAPALKAADIGVAMGVSGTEVAKEASDMVLQDDNFATIVAAVEEGRHAWNNLQKAILYTLPTNAAQAMLILGAVLLAAQVPLFQARFVLEPVQILWINLLDSVLLTMPLMLEAKEPGLLSTPPRPARAKIIDALFLQRVVLLGFAISIPGFLVYWYFGSAAVSDTGEILDARLLTQAQTAAFWGILLAHFGYLVSARSIRKSFFSMNPFSNHWLLGGIILSILIRFIPTFYPPASSLFRTEDFPSHWWPVVLLCFVPSFAMIELDKLFRRLFGRGGAESGPDAGSGRA